MRRSIRSARMGAMRPIALLTLVFTLAACDGPRKQAQVALLLADGRTNIGIARTLTISTHTARRHTEMVMLKLDVRPRAEVPARVMS